MISCPESAGNLGARWNFEGSHEGVGYWMKVLQWNFIQIRLRCLFDVCQSFLD
jgi:hypothetical protein